VTPSVCAYHREPVGQALSELAVSLTRETVLLSPPLCLALPSPWFLEPPSILPEVPVRFTLFRTPDGIAPRGGRFVFLPPGAILFFSFSFPFLYDVQCRLQWRFSPWCNFGAATRPVSHDCQGLSPSLGLAPSSPPPFLLFSHEIIKPLMSAFSICRLGDEAFFSNSVAISCFLFADSPIFFFYPCLHAPFLP